VRFIATLAAALFVAWTGPSSFAAESSSDSAAIDFARDIRPILSENCFSCHGPDKAARQADLRLDLRAAALSDLDGRRAIVPGDPGKSELFRRISTTDADERMPPVDSKKKLTPQQIETLGRWIKQGADWGKHWAFIAPRRPQLPAVKNGKWVGNPIDAFVLARMEKDGLAPSPLVDRVTLLRRLSLDLIGLPPTIEEVDAFLADKRSDAYARQVNRLLKSPHYGERWGRIWLDAARYADSDGFEKDKPRFVWFYRDWVINAINQDLPYDQFIIQQIAGDLLPSATQDQIVATGFLRNSMINEEGGVDPEQFRMEAMFDRMDAIGKSILGLTIQCAQCHSHKYDPLTQEEYYRMFAFVNDSHEANITVYSPQQRAQRRKIFRKIRETENQLKRLTPDWRERMAQWESSIRDNQPSWTVLAIKNAGSNSQRYYPQTDHSLLAQGYAPTKHDAPFSAATELPEIRAFRLELLTDPNLPARGPGRSIDGLCALTEFKVEAVSTRDPKQRKKVQFIRATADFSNQRKQLAPLYGDAQGKRGFTGPVEYAIDGKTETAWGIDAGPGRRNQSRQAVFVAKENIAFAKGTTLAFSLSQKHGGANSDDNQNMNLGRFRISVTGDENAAADPLPRRVRRIISIPADRRTPAQTAAVFSYWRTTVGEWKTANQQIEQLWQSHPQGTTQLVYDRRDRPRETFVLQRGDFLKPVQPVTPAVPAFLHPLPADQPADRLTFARWLVDRKSPTTARAFVNRVWQNYFGVGIVNTAEDLGSQGETPSHPLLLDWLAVEFTQNGWSLKNLHRLIVTSSTYRQSSHVTAESFQRDPYNRLLTRGPRFRVDAEIVRDIALSSSGLFNPQIGGPSVYPPAPQFMFQRPASYGPKTWNVDTGPNRYRRALYTFRFRSVPYPVLQAFDAPNGDFSCVRRPRSNTPLQALAVLNEPLFVECAKALARKTIEQGGATDSQRLEYAFRRVLSRKPSSVESSVLIDFLERQAKRFSNGEADPTKLVTVKKGSSTTPAHLAAWTALARVLLNLDETITKE
jgi:mono/diheme cytochrome c family protein